MWPPLARDLCFNGTVSLAKVELLDSWSPWSGVWKRQAREPTIPASGTISNTNLSCVTKLPLDAMYNNELSSTQCEKHFQGLYTILAGKNSSYKSRTAAAAAKIIEIMLKELTLAAPLYGAGAEG